MSRRHNPRFQSDGKAPSGHVGGSADFTEEWIPALDGKPGQLLREYRLIDELGRGGMGRVYKAVHTKLKRFVALKVLPVEQTVSAKAVMRFHREMEAVGQLDHPNIVRAYDAGEHQGRHFLVMEYVEGIDLSKLVERYGQLRISNACEIVRQTGIGLQHAHEHGLVHRDIKPSNIMITRDRQVKILDLGLARLRQEADAPRELTVTGQIMGTVDYMAPEQLNHAHSVDIRADIYSLGCTLFQLLTGEAPFAQPKYDGVAQVMMAHLSVPPPPIQKRRGDVPDEVAGLLERMLAKDADQRFQTPTELVQAIEPFARQHDLNALALRACSGELAAPDMERETESTQSHALSAVADTSVAKPNHRDDGLAVVPCQSASEGGRGQPSAAVSSWSGLREVKQVVSSRLAVTVTGTAILALAMVLLAGLVNRVFNFERKPSALESLSDGKTGQIGRIGEVHIDDIESADITQLQVFEGHEDQVNSVAMSPDGKYAVSGGLDTTLRLWDLTTGKELPRSMKHSEWIWSVAISPDGNYAVAGGGGKYVDGEYAGQDFDLRLWNIMTGEEIRRFKGHTGQVNGLAFSSDGDFIISGSSDSTVRQWRVRDGQEVAVFRGHEGGVLDVALSPDNRLAVSGSSDSTIRIWDVIQGKEIRVLQGHWEMVMAVSLSPDGKYVLSGSSDTTMRLWETTTGQLVRMYRGHETGLQCAAFTSDGRMAISSSGTLPYGNGSAFTAGWDYRFRLWNVETGEELGEWPSHDGGAMEVNVASAGRFMLTSGVDGILRLWELPAMQALAAEPKTTTTTDKDSFAWPTDILRAGRVGAPDLANMDPVEYDDFNDTGSGFYQGFYDNDESNTEYRYDSGRYRVDTPHPIAVFSTPWKRYANFACQMVGRVATPDGRWGMSLLNSQDHGIMATIDTQGRLQIEPALFEAQPFRGPQVGPLQHPAIRRGNEFNTLLLVVRGRQVEVYVNSTAVVQPIYLDREITPAQIRYVYGLGSAPERNQPSSRIELERIAVWPAETIPSLETRGAVVK